LQPVFGIQCLGTAVCCFFRYIVTRRKVPDSRVGSGKIVRNRTLRRIGFGTYVFGRTGIRFQLASKIHRVFGSPDERLREVHRIVDDGDPLQVITMTPGAPSWWRDRFAARRYAADILPSGALWLSSVYCLPTCPWKIRPMYVTRQGTDADGRPCRSLALWSVATPCAMQQPAS